MLDRAERHRPAADRPNGRRQNARRVPAERWPNLAARPRHQGLHTLYVSPLKAHWRPTSGRNLQPASRPRWTCQSGSKTAPVTRPKQPQTSPTSRPATYPADDARKSLALVAELRRRATHIRGAAARRLSTKSMHLADSQAWRSADAGRGAPATRCRPAVCAASGCRPQSRIPSRDRAAVWPASRDPCCQILHADPGPRTRHRRCLITDEPPPLGLAEGRNYAIPAVLGPGPPAQDHPDFSQHPRTGRDFLSQPLAGQQRRVCPSASTTESLAREQRRAGRGGDGAPEACAPSSAPERSIWASTGATSIW